MEESTFGRFDDFLEYGGVICRSSKVLYVPTPKVACTSLKWALAEWEGTVRDPSQSRNMSVTRDQTIHDFEIHGLGRLPLLSPSDRAEVLGSSEWLRFCVTRDPAARVLSGWVNRVVLQPIYDERITVFTTVPDGPVDPVDLRIPFRQFVRELQHEGSAWLDDPHFKPQVPLLGIGRFPYTDVVDIARVDSFVGSLSARSGAGRPFPRLRRANATPTYPVRAMFDDETAAIVAQVYADDYRVLGYTPIVPDPEQLPVFVGENEQRLLREARERARRIEDILGVMYADAWRLRMARSIKGSAANLLRAVRQRVDAEVRARRPRGYRGGR